jgi:hypothetical protein
VRFQRFLPRITRTDVSDLWCDLASDGRDHHCDQGRPARLLYLDGVPGATGFDVAQEFGVPYATAAIALLRLVRQGLASRARNHEALYAYALTDRGQERLIYLEEEKGPTVEAAPADWVTSNTREGEDIVKKRKTFHTGLYHCPHCCVAYSGAS